ncbi:MAG: purine-nucleoside phosphorylase [bacterium]|nr:purine-nucleoside phosphorylase [bacterium]
MKATERLADGLAQGGAAGARVALVLGSGLGSFAERLENARTIGFDELDDMPKSRVPGHAGRFVAGELGGVRVVVQSGRVHLYEGWSPTEVTRSVRAFAALGCEALVLTNAAGGLAREWPVPCLMRVSDHINLQSRTPLGANEAGSGSPYDAELARALEEAAERARVELFSGVYAGLLGPSYETPAEIAHLGRIGAHAVGMSTVCEALAGRAAGMRVAAISCISNPAAGISATPLDHGEVVAAGKAIAGDFERLLAEFLPRAV